ncbi:MAG TPA: hypothetical protein IGS17_07315 [Oscillatoriales cyanobacterium M59_W2019_021]|nr:MAG: hypothetical protein D6728_10310 [Cyanobacteria bacterium J055]HIK33782.1 hypothetical protein [Oscillatoriales cyanobacterium M4454_W2019_049]HIK50719.1 hypothetical protein [Oscillatoriales cyanobacterium M59_W2019_021]
MNSTSISHLYFVRANGDNGNSSTPSTQPVPTTPQPETDTDYDLAQLCDDLAKIKRRGGSGS